MRPSERSWTRALAPSMATAAPTGSARADVIAPRHHLRKPDELECRTGTRDRSAAPNRRRRGARLMRRTGGPSTAVFRRSLGQRILVSANFAAACRDDRERRMLLGRYTLHGVGRPQKSYSPSTSIDPMRFKHRPGMRASAAHQALARDDRFKRWQRHPYRTENVRLRLAPPERSSFKPRCFGRPLTH